MGEESPSRNDYGSATTRYATLVPIERVLLFRTNKGRLFERMDLAADDPGAGYDNYMHARAIKRLRSRCRRDRESTWAAGPDWRGELQVDPFTSVVAKVQISSGR